MSKPASSTSVTQNEVREILALATEKSLGQFLQTARRAGLNVDKLSTADDEERFAEQLDATQADEISQIRALPHMLVAIRPLSFGPNVLRFEDVRPLVDASTVRWRGWPFPWVQSPVAGKDWIGETLMDPRHTEGWRLHTSGYFVHVEAIGTWRADAETFSDGTDDEYLPVWLPLLHFTEALEFAARLQKSSFADESLFVEFELHGIRGRSLVAANPSRAGFHGRYQYGDDTWSEEVEVTPELALTGTADLAVETCRQLFLRFGWNGVTTELLEGVQDEVFTHLRTTD